MTDPALNQATLNQIDKAVAAYAEKRTEYVDLARRVVDHLITNHDFREIIHSAKYREKEPESLHDKLNRKAREAAAESKPFSVKAANVFTEVDDLAGVRVLHLHSRQIVDIHSRLIDILDTYDYSVVGNPEAFSWDIETRELFEELGFDVRPRPSPYTSVHYVIEPHYARARCEIQVRTLAEELWGEVSHALDYPHATKSEACSEQILALARFTSGCSRLVDSIFVSHREYERLSAGASASSSSDGSSPGAPLTKRTATGPGRPQEKVSKKATKKPKRTNRGRSRRSSG